MCQRIMIGGKYKNIRTGKAGLSRFFSGFLSASNVIIEKVEGNKLVVKKED